MPKTKKYKSVIVAEKHDQDGYPVYAKDVGEPGKPKLQEISPAEALPLLNTSSCTVIDARSLFESRDWFGVVKLHFCFEAQKDVQDDQVVQVPDRTPGGES